MPFTADVNCFEWDIEFAQEVHTHGFIRVALNRHDKDGWFSRRFLTTTPRRRLF